MQDSEFYIYKSSNMAQLANSKNMDAIQIQEWVTQVQEWLYENVCNGCANNYEWAETGYIKGEKVHFPSYIYFRYQADLVAFKLRWL